MTLSRQSGRNSKEIGYERIVFFDNDQKLYCYDDESFKLLTKTTKEDSPGKANAGVSAEPRLQKGLRRGRNAHRMGSAAADTTPPSDMPQEGAVQQEPEDTVSEDQSWKAGVHSGVLVKNTVGGPLHLGMTDNTFVKRQMDAYMYNAAIKTAVVINDPTTFLHEFGSDPLHSLTAGYERLGSENQNIMIFIYTDNDLASIYEVKKMVEENKDALNNIINIPSPNAIELKNMLMYMKINYGLKIRLSELTEVAVALYQALQLSEQPVRIKELYTRLRGFEKEKLLDKDSCYELLGTKKPESAKEQLDALKTYRDGIKAYTNGVKKASDGSSKLKEGTDQLEEGTKELMKAFDMETSNLTQFLKADDNIRIGAAAGDQVISKLAGMVAGVIIMILFTYVISVFVIHEIEKENSIIGTLYALGVIKKQLLKYYLTVPVIVTFLAGLAGTIIGYSPIGIPTQMQDCYDYFSIPDLSPELLIYLLVYGIVMPPLVAVIVNYFVIRKKLSRPALSMIRK